MAVLRDERGQTAPEFITVLAVVAVIVALLVGSGIAAVARGSTRSTVCRVLNDDDCDRTVALAAPAEQPAPAAPALGPENYARVPQLSLGQAAEQAAGRPLTGFECAALATYDPGACGSPRAPGPLTDDEIRQLYIAFGGEAGEANQLLCGVDVFFAASGDLASACKVLREATGTTTGDEAVAALAEGIRQVLELERNLPLGDELLRALEIAMGETINGEPVSNAQRLRNLLAIAASILPADEVAQLAAIVRRGGNSDEVAAHIDDALGRSSRVAREQAERSELIDELARAGVKHTPENIVHIGRSADGSIVFLEVGDAASGLLRHIVDRHAAHFAAQGVAENEIADLVFAAATTGSVVGMQGTRPIYEVMFNGELRRVAITVGENGYIVGANPRPRP